MSADDKKKKGETTVRAKVNYTIPANSPWASAWVRALVIGLAGVGAAGYAWMREPSRFAYSWLFAFIVFLTLALGSMFFVLIERLTSANWSVTTRRTAEFFANEIWVFALLFVPILMNMGTLFPWLHQGGEQHHASVDLITPAHAQTNPAVIHDPHAVAAEPEAPAGAAPAHPAPAPAHGNGAGTGGGGGVGTGRGEGGGIGHGHEPLMMGAPGAHPHGAAHAPDPEHVLHEEVLKKKVPYLNKNFFIGRAVVYFLLWWLIASRLFGFSTRQDTSKDMAWTVKAQRFAPGATILFALTLTFAAFDWIMSLEPSWYSTIFGVTIFAGSVVCMFATMILVTMALRADGLLKDAVNVEHFHDLGKLLFGFVVFWAYVSFSQFMLIWYAALPEETTFYHQRWEVGPWRTISLLIVVAHFVVPFFMIVSRNAKRNLGILKFGAMWILAMHVIEMYWLVMPNYAGGHVTPSWVDLACLFGVGGLYVAMVLRRMTQHPLIPVGDPRLARALAFENA